MLYSLLYSRLRNTLASCALTLDDIIPDNAEFIAGVAIIFSGGLSDLFGTSAVP